LVTGFVLPIEGLLPGSLLNEWLAMKLADLIVTEQVLNGVAVPNKHSLLHELSKRAGETLRLDPQKVNIYGGAVAMGHPIGASGAAVLVKLVYAMVDRGARRGIAALCLGGGSAVALAVELV